MIQPDLLSRRIDHETEEQDNQQVTLLPQELFVNMVDIHLKEEILSSNVKDKTVLEALKTLQEQETTQMKQGLKKWIVEEEIPQYQGQIYILDNKELKRKKIIQIHHDSLPIGYPRWRKILEIIQ